MKWYLAIDKATAEKMHTTRLAVRAQYGIYSAGRNLDETAEKAAGIYNKIAHAHENKYFHTNSSHRQKGKRR